MNKTRDWLTTIHAQVVLAGDRRADLKRNGRTPRSAKAVQASLERTYRCLKEGFGPSAIAQHSGFVIRRRPNGDCGMFWRSDPLPVSSAYVKRVFIEAGVTLVRGQAVLADPRLVRLIIRKSLADLGRIDRDLENEVRRLRRLRRGGTPGELRRLIARIRAQLRVERVLLVAASTSADLMRERSNGNGAA